MPEKAPVEEKPTISRRNFLRAGVLSFEYATLKTLPKKTGYEEIRATLTQVFINHCILGAISMSDLYKGSVIRRGVILTAITRAIPQSYNPLNK